MKTPFLLALVPFLTTAPAAVILNDATIGTNPAFPIDRAFTVTSAQSLVIEVTTSAPGQFTFQYWSIANSYGLFRVSQGTAFDAAFVNSTPAFVNNWANPGTGTLSLTGAQSEYLAYWDQSSGPPSLTATSADRYGWARVTNAGGKLIVTASATADSGGIIVGTLDQIPEPASTSLLTTSLAALCLQRNRTRRPF